ncbi:MAG TPA: GTPase, partial [Gemmataceae bacterium]|nr:GTPase [Gemmataceae bacterium]
LFWLGRFGDHSNSSFADEVVLTLCRLTPEPQVEVHCHGGREVIAWLQQILEAHGVSFCSWEDFESPVPDNRFKSAAEIALANAPTLRTAGILLDQMNGALAKALALIRAAWQRSDADEAGRLIQELARYTALGRHLISPWRVAILGAPNVGKSSLVNALAGYQRCIVAPTLGTTRDVVTTLSALDGWPVELADTAGMRDRAEALEKQGIDLAKTTGREADLCLWIVDASQQPIWPSQDWINVRLIINKIDLAPVWNLSQAGEAIRVSAQTGTGIPTLCLNVARWLVPDPPSPGAAVPFTPELARKLEEAKRFHDAGKFPDALHILGGI